MKYKQNKNAPIGLFDSGVGGLTVLKHLINVLPQENYIYFGDTLRVPYGEKTKEELYTFVTGILDWFKSHNVKIVLMACNTSSAVVLEEVKNNYDFPILGLIEPTAEHIASMDANKIGVIATSATIKSKAYSQQIIKLSPQKKVYEIPCPGLVEIVENDIAHTDHAHEKVFEYINPLIKNQVEKIILGCTHYPYLGDVINKITASPNMLVDPAQYLTEQLVNKLKELNLFNNESNCYRKFYVSTAPDKFVKAGQRFLPDCQKAVLINPIKY